MERCDATLYDGVTATPHRVSLRLEGDALEIVGTGERVPLSALRPLGDRRNDVFGRTGVDGWRLRLDRPSPQLAAALPRQEYHGGILDRFGVLPVVVVCALVATALVVAVARSAVLVAQLVPERWEASLGSLLVGGDGGDRCDAPDGSRALHGLVARLGEGGTPVEVHVVRLPLVNAVALPGRHIVVFSGLIDKAKSPDELAGVLGHELGHVAHRDPLVTLVRNFGLSLLVGGADGGALMQGLLLTSYSRNTEGAADAYAIRRLQVAHISPAATAAFFDRLSKAEPHLGRADRVVNYLSTHPLSADRRAAFLGSVRKGGGYHPAMTFADWQSLRDICVSATIAAPAKRSG